MNISCKRRELELRVIMSVGEGRVECGENQGDAEGRRRVQKHFSPAIRLVVCMCGSCDAPLFSYTIAIELSGW